MFFDAYSLLWRAARPVLRRHKRLRADFAQRLVPEEWGAFPWGRQPADLWVQAASGGEAFLARQLLAVLNECCASQHVRVLRVLATSCTRQGLDVLEAAPAMNHMQLAVRVFPLDEPALMRRACDLAAPRALALLETELWPGLMFACAQSSTPVMVLNGRMTAKSHSWYRLLAPLWRRISPAKIFAMSQPDAARFADLFGRERVSLMPNMKFDGVSPHILPIDPASPAFSLLPPDLPVILLASIRQEEESLLIPVITYLRNNAPQAAIVVAPRHMERVAAWDAALTNTFGANHALRSSLEQRHEAAGSGQVIIWDRFGELTALYARANAVFVGGSLAPLGGQNFLEAAGQGRVPIIGPYWKNFAWVGESFFTAALARRVASSSTLGQTLLTLLNNPPDPDTVRLQVEAYIAPRRGGSRLAAQAVMDMIGTPRQASAME